MDGRVSFRVPRRKRQPSMEGGLFLKLSNGPKLGWGFHVMVDSVSERCNRPTEFHVRDLATQRIQVTIRMRTHWVRRWNNVVRTTLTHLGIFATSPFELLPSGLFGLV